MSNIREYTIDYSDKQNAARQTLTLHIDTLASFRGTTPHPEELEWEIRVYQFMFDSDDPEARLREYGEMRHSERFKLMPKREAIARLGWDIP